MNPIYSFRATVLRVKDGDTVDLDVDLGFKNHLHETFRLFGVDAPEKVSESGKAAKAWMEQKLPVGTAVTIQSFKMETELEQEKYGRWLAYIWLGSKTSNLVADSLNHELVATGHAREYYGGKR